MLKFFKINATLIILMSLVVLLQACRTYYMTPTGLEAELHKINEATIKECYHFELGIIPALIVGKQFNNGLYEITVTNKTGDDFLLRVNDKTQMRITLKNGKRKTLLFDTVFSNESAFYGNQSRFFGLTILPAKFDEIVKIEIQSPMSRLRPVIHN